jgi:4-amino-4-deoxy-L-arabinose transferase-like glycosyltransferase
VGLDPYRGVQLVSAASALAIVVLVLLLARELFPRSPGTQLAALVLAGGTPVLLRAGALYHPEALAAALTAAGLYVVVRGLARGALTWRAGLAAGVLLGLANLTRTWALAALAAALAAIALDAAWRRSRPSAAAFAALATAAGVLVVPWLAYKAVEHGSPLAYSQPIASQWREDGRPASFYVDLPLGEVFSTPYAPHFSNRLAAVVYTDWWGDYWRSWEVPARLHASPAELPREYERPRVVQSVAGLLPTIAVLAGFAVLAVRAVRRRDAALAALLLSGALLAVSFVAFLIRYPKLDGDNIKALYVLNATPVVAVCAGFACAWVAARHTILRVAVAVVLAGILGATLFFVALPAS